MKNNKNIGYWIVTGLFGAVYLGSGTADVLHAAPVLETLGRLGFPAYLASILGPWKIAGALALLAPKLPRVKEWAYAGMVFDLTGAIAAHAIFSEAALVVPAVLLGLVVVSYLLRPADRRLAGPVAEESRAPIGAAVAQS